MVYGVEVDVGLKYQTTRGTRRRLRVTKLRVTSARTKLYEFRNNARRVLRVYEVETRVEDDEEVLGLDLDLNSRRGENCLVIFKEMGGFYTKNKYIKEEISKR